MLCRKRNAQPQACDRVAAAVAVAELVIDLSGGSAGKAPMATILEQLGDAGVIVVTPGSETNRDPQLVAAEPFKLQLLPYQLAGRPFYLCKGASKTQWDRLRAQAREMAKRFTSCFLR